MSEICVKRRLKFACVSIATLAIQYAPSEDSDQTANVQAYSSIASRKHTYVILTP